MAQKTATQLKNQFQDTDPTDQNADIVDSLGAGAGGARTAITFASATQTLVTVPANSIITSVKVARTTAWDAITTFQVGKTGTLDWLVTTPQANVDGAITGGEEGEVEIIDVQKVVTTATPIILTLNQGGAVAGAGYVTVEYTELT